MPIIQLAGSGTGGVDQLGQALGTFDAATAQGRQNAERRREVGLRLAQQKALREQQFARDAENELYDRDLQERKFGLAQDRQQREEFGSIINRAASGRGGVPAGVSQGQTLYDMAVKLESLDEEEYLGFEQWFDTTTGGAYPDGITPEILDGLPQRAQIAAYLAPRYYGAERRADAQSIAQGEVSLRAKVNSLSPTFMASELGQAWDAKLDLDLAQAAAASAKAKPGEGFTAIDAAALYREAFEEAREMVVDQDARVEYQGKFDAYRASEKWAGVTREDKAIAMDALANMYDSEDPYDEFMQAMIAVDPDYAYAMLKGKEQGTTEAAAANAAMRVREQDAAIAQKAKGSGRMVGGLVGMGTNPLMGKVAGMAGERFVNKNTPRPDVVPPDANVNELATNMNRNNVPGAAKLVGVEDEVEVTRLRDRLAARGVDMTKAEDVRAAIEEDARQGEGVRSNRTETLRGEEQAQRFPDRTTDEQEFLEAARRNNVDMDNPDDVASFRLKFEEQIALRDAKQREAARNGR